MEDLRKESSQTESQCRDRKKTLSEDKDSDDRSRKKDNVKSSSASEKYRGEARTRR